MLSDMEQRTPARAATLIALAATATAVLGGCGGSATKTVSAAQTPTIAQTTGTDTQPTTSTATTTTTATGTSSTPTRTRTAPEPAFAEKEKSSGGSGGEGLSAAEALVRAHGYTPEDPSDYHPNQTLRVLIGVGANSNQGFDRLAFFFVDGRYIGTDSTQPSAQVSVVAQSDTEVTLAYSLYRSGDPLCCPGGGQAKVRFQLNNGQLQSLDSIPPVSSKTGLSRQ
jgi:LppP/LprE lipoprotein